MKSILSIAIAVLMAAIPQAVAADGKAVYDKKCSSCHGPDGKGDTKMGKKLNCRDLSDAGVQAKLTDAQIAKSINQGVTEDGKLRMKPIKGLSADEVAAVVKYVRTLKK